MQLLDRTREGPKLTDAGRVLVSHAEAAIARLDEAERELAAIAGLEGGELRLASFPSASATLLTEAVSTFHRRHPARALERRRRRARGIAPATAGGRARPGADLRLPLAPEARRARPRSTPRADRVDARGAAEVDTSSPRRSVVPLAELADVEWLCGSRPSTCGEVIFDACRSAGFEPRIGFESDDYHVMQGFIAAGLGVTLLPDLALATLRSDLVVRPTDPKPPERRVWAADPRGGLALAGDRGDALDPRRGRRLVRGANREAPRASPPIGSR